MSRKTSLPYDEIEIILIEIEHVINTHQIIPNNCVEDLNPWHLLHGCNSAKLVLPNRSIALNNREKIQNRQKYIGTLLNKLWKRFLNEYTISIREIHLHNRQKCSRDMKLEVGDTVVIKEDKPIPRLTWKLGEVTNLTKGRDSNLQIAKIDVIANNTNHAIK